MTPTLLLIATPTDYHAAAVAWGLQQYGVYTHFWPTIAPEHTISFDFATDALLLGGYSIRDTHALWVRRPQIPRLHPDLSPHDHSFVNGELNHLIKSALITASELSNFTVNHWLRHDYISKKPHQLRLAKQLGFAVPETVITNDPQVARRLFSTDRRRWIYKSLIPHIWESKDAGKLFQSQTALVSAEDMKSDFHISSCPLTLQSYVEKSWEARVVVMGSCLIAARIDASDRLHDGQAAVDWRMEVSAANFRVARTDVPGQVGARIRQFMVASGLVFGCFDFVVDPHGNWLFLEVNPGGQFLWMDDHDMECSLLDTFCHFLIDRRDDFNQIHYGQHVNTHVFDQITSEAPEPTQRDLADEERMVMTSES